MKHPDEDTQVKYVLDLLEENDRRAVSDHLDICNRCRERCRTIEREIGMIAGIDPELSSREIELPVRRRFHLPVGLRVAALLLLSFFVGYGSFRLFRPMNFHVVPAYNGPNAPSRTIEEFSICESVNLGTE